MLLYQMVQDIKGSEYMKATKDSIREIEGMTQAGVVTFQGLEITIENPEGSIREGTKEDGTKWETTFFHAYGYINGTKGADGDEVDCFLGPNPEAVFIYVIHQKQAGKYDEDKCMLGFDSEESARDAYLAHYDTQGNLGEITAIPKDEFIADVKNAKIGA